MNEILIELYVPALGKRYDIFIPASAKLFEITALVRSAVEKLADGLFFGEGAVLCAREDGRPLDINLAPAALGLRNGSPLLMI